MTAEIIITNDLPKTTLAISTDVLEQRDALIARAGIYETITDAETFATVDALNNAVIKLDDWIESERVRLKKPLLDFTRSFDATFSEARTSLIVQRTRLGKLVIAYRDAENARRAAVHKAQQEAAKKAAEEAAQKASEEAAARAAATPADAPAPWEEPTVIIPAVQPPARLQVLKSSSVTTRAKPVLIIDDATLIPRDLCDPNKERITARIKSGMSVPGCRMSTDTIIAAKG